MKRVVKVKTRKQCCPCAVLRRSFRNISLFKHRSSLSVLRAGRTFSPFGFGQGCTIFYTPEKFHRAGSLFLNTLKDGSTDANLIIIFGSPSVSFFPEKMFPEFQHLRSLDTFDRDDLCRERRAVNEIQNVVNYLRTHISDGGHIVYVASSVMGGTQKEFEFFHAAAVVFPSMPYVEIRQLTFSPSGIIENSSRETADEDRIYSMNTAIPADVKCVLVFTDNSVEGKRINAKLISESSFCVFNRAVIVGGRISYQSKYTGLSFSGENIRIECIYLREKNCCIKNQLEYLKRMGFQNKTGIAFLLSSPFLDPTMAIFKWFKKYFPRITLLGIPCEEIFFSNVMARGFLEKCNTCEDEVRRCSHESSSNHIIMFILFKTDKCKLKCYAFP